MVDANTKLFDSFTLLHSQYRLDMNNLQEEFNKTGERVMDAIREWEQKLCSQSEKGGYSKFTGNLSEKFMDEVRIHFPLIDRVGIIITKKPNAFLSGFSLKKIKL
jgi:hypothetical protein